MFYDLLTILLKELVYVHSLSNLTKIKYCIYILKKLIKTTGKNHILCKQLKVAKRNVLLIGIDITSQIHKKKIKLSTTSKLTNQLINKISNISKQVQR